MRPSIECANEQLDLQQRDNWTHHRSNQPLLLSLALKVKGERSSSSMPTFVQFMASAKVNYHVKLHQNLTSSFEITAQASFLSKNNKLALKVKCQGRMSLNSDHFSGSP